MRNQAVRRLTQAADEPLRVAPRQLDGGALWLALLMVEESVTLDHASVSWGGTPVHHDGRAVQGLQVELWSQRHCGKNKGKTHKHKGKSEVCTTTTD